MRCWVQYLNSRSGFWNCCFHILQDTAWWRCQALRFETCFKGSWGSNCLKATHEASKHYATQTAPHHGRKDQRVNHPAVSIRIRGTLSCKRSISCIVADIQCLVSSPKAWKKSLAWSAVDGRWYVDEVSPVAEKKTSRIFQVPDVLTFPKTDSHYFLRGWCHLRPKTGSKSPAMRWKLLSSTTFWLLGAKSRTFETWHRSQSETHWIGCDLKLAWHVMAALDLTVPARPSSES